MKKCIFLILAIIFTVTGLSACDKKAVSEEFLPIQSFTVHMTAQKDSKKFEADIKCLSVEDITLTFTSPKELSGFSVSTSESGYSINIFGVPDELSTDELNSSSVINVLTNTLKISVFKNHGNFIKTENGIEADLTVDSVPVHVTFSEDGLISSLEAASIGFLALFQKLLWYN